MVCTGGARRSARRLARCALCAAAHAQLRCAARRSTRAPMHSLHAGPVGQKSGAPCLQPWSASSSPLACWAWGSCQTSSVPPSSTCGRAHTRGSDARHECRVRWCATTAMCAAMSAVHCLRQWSTVPAARHTAAAAARDTGHAPPCGPQPPRLLLRLRAWGMDPPGCSRASPRRLPSAACRSTAPAACTGARSSGRARRRPWAA